MFHLILKSDCGLSPQNEISNFGDSINNIVERIGHIVHLGAFANALAPILQEYTLPLAEIAMTISGQP